MHPGARLPKTKRTQPSPWARPAGWSASPAQRGAVVKEALLLEQHDLALPLGLRTAAPKFWITAAMEDRHHHDALLLRLHEINDSVRERSDQGAPGSLVKEREGVWTCTDLQQLLSNGSQKPLAKARGLIGVPGGGIFQILPCLWPDQKSHGLLAQAN